MRPRLVVLVPVLLTVILSACAAGSRSGPTAVDARTQIAPSASITREQLAERRAAAIARLREYRMAGVFPKNRISDDKINVFIDEDGHLCAAANLMSLDGKIDLVHATAQRNNTIRLADVRDGELLAWMLASGLTQEEIALIQEPYMPEEPASISFEQQERDRLQQHFLMVEQQLERDTDKSLDIAMSRLPSAA